MKENGFVDSQATEYFHAVTKKVLGFTGDDPVARLPRQHNFDWRVLHGVLKKNVITLRALDGVDFQGEAKWGDLPNLLEVEKGRCQGGASIIKQLGCKLDGLGVRYAIIKTLDQYPDIGHDIDYLILDHVDTIRDMIGKEFNGELKPPTLSDRLACKTNFRLHGYPTLEQHYGRIGQVGEDTSLVKSLMDRITAMELEGVRISIPSGEYRILLATLQRIYRHFNIRLCDIVNTAGMIRAKQIDWNHLFLISRQLGLFRGVSYYLSFIDKICEEHGHAQLLPKDVREKFHVDRHNCPLQIQRDHYRFPIWSIGPSVYLGKFLAHLKHLEVSSVIRLSVIPAFALFTYLNIKLLPQYPAWKRIW